MAALCPTPSSRSADARTGPCGHDTIKHEDPSSCQALRRPSDPRPHFLTDRRRLNGDRQVGLLGALVWDDDDDHQEHSNNRGDTANAASRISLQVQLHAVPAGGLARMRFRCEAGMRSTYQTPVLWSTTDSQPWGSPSVALMASSAVQRLGFPTYRALRARVSRERGEP